MQRVSLWLINLCILTGLLFMGLNAYNQVKKGSAEYYGFCKGDLKYNYKWGVRR